MTVDTSDLVIRGRRGPAELEALRAEYERTGFCQTGTGWATAGLATYARRVFQSAVRSGEQVATPHRLENGRLLGGARFCRLDPGRPGLDPDTSAAVQAAWAELGSTEFFAGMRAALRELTDRVLPRYRYERGYFLAYRPGDYLSPHDDRSTGDRVNVQMPVTSGGAAALRTLASTGFLEPHPDDLGTVRVLGPAIWHDVPPLLADADGFRVVFSLRFRRVEAVS